MSKLGSLPSRPTIGSLARNDDVLKAVVLAFVVLTLLAASIDRRSAILDRASGVPQRIAPPADPPSTAALIDDMLTHD